VENKDIVRDYFAKLKAGDARAAFAHLAPDCEYNVMGTTALSGPTRGVREFIDHTIKPLGALLDGGIEMILDEVVGEGDTVVALARSKAMALTGIPYANTYAIVFRFQDGKVASVAEFLDTALVETAIYGKKIS
jgi:hypothetical protein